MADRPLITSPEHPALAELCAELAGRAGELDKTEAWPREHARLQRPAANRLAGQADRLAGCPALHVGGVAFLLEIDMNEIKAALEWNFQGKPKPIAFPDPRTTAVRGARFALLPMPRFIELKLASGMVAPHRAMTA